MNKNSLRTLILILGIATALIHLYLNIRLGRFDPAFTLNALGYGMLLVALFGNISLLRNRGALVHYAFMAFTALSIIAWAAISGNLGDTVAVIDKAIEIGLFVSLWLHLRR